MWAGEPGGIGSLPRLDGRNADQFAAEPRASGVRAIALTALDFFSMETNSFQAAEFTAVEQHGEISAIADVDLDGVCILARRLPVFLRAP